MAKRKVTVGNLPPTLAAMAEAEEFELGGKTFKTERPITMPVWKWAEGETKCFQILDRIEASERLSGAEEVVGKRRGGKEPLPPAHVAHVKDLVSGGMFTLIFGVGLERDIVAAFPGETYVNKSFKATKLPAVKTAAGFHFNPYSISLLAG